MGKSALAYWPHALRSRWHRLPVPLPKNWIAYVNAPQTPGELEAIRNCVNRQSPFGAPEWAARKAAEFGLEQTLAPLGRPRKQM